MDASEFELRSIPLHGPSKNQLADFLNRFGLELEPDLSYAVGLFAGNVLIACGGCSTNVIKCVAVDESVQGSGLLATVVTHLYLHLKNNGAESIFIYTKPEHKNKFTALGFSMLAETGKIMLLESDPKGISGFIRKIQNRFSVLPAASGAIVMNANPFTRGHQYLVRKAAEFCQHLFIFVVQEERSHFPAEIRFRLITEGVRDIPNVTAVNSSSYLISAASFPTYFLKEKSRIMEDQAELDCTLFAEKIAPPLRITQRFVGSEPLDPMTNEYNTQMQKVLPAHGIQVVCVPRFEIDSLPVSASRVRKLLGEGGPEAVRRLVPETTFAFLQSEEAFPILQALRQEQSKPC